MRAIAERQIDVEVALAPEAWRHWDVDSKSWRVEPGLALVHCDSSAGDLPLMATVVLDGET